MTVRDHLREMPFVETLHTNMKREQFPDLVERRRTNPGRLQKLLGFLPGAPIEALDDDGRLDMAAAAFTSDVITVRLNTAAIGAATPSFGAQFDFAAAGNPNGLAAADLNNDGRPDLAFVNNSAAKVSVQHNTATFGRPLAYAAKTDFGTSVNPMAIASADLNGDGRRDLAIAHQGAAVVSMLLNTTVPGAATPSFAPKVDIPINSTQPSLPT